MRNPNLRFFPRRSDRQPGWNGRLVFRLGNPVSSVTGLAVPLVFSRTMKAVGYEFDAAIPRFTTGFIFCATISLIWYLVIQSNEIGWQYTGLFWMIFTVFLAPAYLGGVFTARHYNSRPTAA